MLALIGAVIQLVFLILKNLYNESEEAKKAKEEIKDEWADAIKSGDISRINAVIDKLRLRK